VINRTVINKGINGSLVRDVEIQHLIKHNYVITNSGFVCITNELWGKLMSSQENQGIIKSLRESK